jgi:hypothetical protein
VVLFLIEDDTGGVSAIRYRPDRPKVKRGDEAAGEPCQGLLFLRFMPVRRSVRKAGSVVSRKPPPTPWKHAGVRTVRAGEWIEDVKQIVEVSRPISIDKCFVIAWQGRAENEFDVIPLTW